MSRLFLKLDFSQRIEAEQSGLVEPRVQIVRNGAEITGQKQPPKPILEKDGWTPTEKVLDVIELQFVSPYALKKREKKLEPPQVWGNSIIRGEILCGYLIDYFYCIYDWIRIFREGIINSETFWKIFSLDKQHDGDEPFPTFAEYVENYARRFGIESISLKLTDQELAEWIKQFDVIAIKLKSALKEKNIDGMYESLREAIELG